MSSLRTQKERNRKIGAKDHKLSRLLNTQSLTELDSHFINYLYEERQHLNFFYGLGIPLVGSVALTHGIFRTASTTF